MGGAEDGPLRAPSHNGNGNGTRTGTRNGNGHDPAATAELIRVLTGKVDGLTEALESRDIIGQAKGILMERFHLTSEQAFEQLREASQVHNRKLRELATLVAETGQWPLDGLASEKAPKPASKTAS